jgi:hypothetical protein
LEPFDKRFLFGSLKSRLRARNQRSIGKSGIGPQPDSGGVGQRADCCEKNSDYPLADPCQFDILQSALG